MIPIGDDNRDRRTTPFITWALIAVNVFVFAYFQGFGTNERFTYAYATVPAEILSGKDIVTPDRVFMDRSTGHRYLVPGLQPTPVPVFLTIFISMFMHAGLAHILGNMLYLLIFGDNVEDRLGHFRYLLFYLFCGAVASLAQVYTTLYHGRRSQRSQPRRIRGNLGSAGGLPAPVSRARGCACSWAYSSCLCRQSLPWESGSCSRL